MSKVAVVPLSQDMTNCCAFKFGEKLNCSGTRRAGRKKKNRLGKSGAMTQNRFNSHMP